MRCFPRFFFSFIFSLFRVSSSDFYISFLLSSPTPPKSATSYSAASALVELDRDFKVKKTVVTSLLRYAESARAYFSTMSPPAVPGVEMQDRAVVGRYSHRDTVDTHLSFLQRFLTHGFFLDTEEAMHIWEALVRGAPVPKDREVAYRWFYLITGQSETACHLDPTTLVALFTEKVLQDDPRSLPEEGAGCFARIFLRVNSMVNPNTVPKLQLQPRADEVEVVYDFNMPGLTFLWQIATLHPVDTLANFAVQQLRELYTHPDPKMGDEEHYEQARSILQGAQEPLAKLMQSTEVSGNRREKKRKPRTCSQGKRAVKRNDKGGDASHR